MDLDIGGHLRYGVCTVEVKVGITSITECFLSTCSSEHGVYKLMGDDSGMTVGHVLLNLLLLDVVVGN